MELLARDALEDWVVYLVGTELDPGFGFSFVGMMVGVVTANDIVIELGPGVATCGNR